MPLLTISIQSIPFHSNAGAIMCSTWYIYLHSSSSTRIYRPLDTLSFNYVKAIIGLIPKLCIIFQLIALLHMGQK